MITGLLIVGRRDVCRSLETLSLHVSAGELVSNKRSRARSHGGLAVENPPASTQEAPGFNP